MPMIVLYCPCSALSYRVCPSRRLHSPLSSLQVLTALISALEKKSQLSVLNVTGNMFGQSGLAQLQAKFTK